MIKYTSHILQKQLFQKRLLLCSVMRDAWSMFHNGRCTMVDLIVSEIETGLARFLPLNGPQKAETK